MKFIVFFVSFLISAVVLAKSTANLNPQGVILDGYDPVSYFTEAKPLKGSSAITANIDGITYNFATEANKKLFVANPQKYAPQYQGWCATAVAKGQKYKIDPTSYKITNGRLFLFYYEDGFFGGDAKKEWLKDETQNLKKADANWPQVKNTEE